MKTLKYLGLFIGYSAFISFVLMLLSWIILFLLADLFNVNMARIDIKSFALIYPIIFSCGVALGITAFLYLEIEIIKR